MPPSRSFRTFDEAFAWLAARTNYETMATQSYDARTYGLARVERLLEVVDRPDRTYDVAQVVGSKGKGSTAAALASILRASGRRTGLFTSPHLVDPRERIVVDGAPVADELVVDALERLRPVVEDAAARGEPCTFFEIHTVAALLAFRAARCDAAVLEAGMGGRLDATTAAEARVKVLTSVSLDHTQQLGRTRAAIAREKSAVARRGVPLISGEELTTPAGRVIASSCRRAGAPLLAIGRDFTVRRIQTQLDPATAQSRTSFVLTRLRRSSSLQPPASSLPFSLPLLGRYQARNGALAAVAALTATWRGSAVTAEHVREGLAQTHIRARLEVLSTRPLLLVDGAHTPASMSQLAATIRDAVPHRRAVFVVGMSADKDVRGALRRLRGVADLVVATTSGQPRAAPPAAIAAAARAAGLRATPASDVDTALAVARRRAGPDDVIVVTGSLYLCGRALAAGGKAADR